MILSEIASSTGDPADERSFNVIFRDDSGYLYAAGYLQPTWFYNSSLGYITQDNFIQTDFQLWPSTGYFVQTNTTTEQIRLARFNGTTSFNIFYATVTGSAKGCAVNGTYAYFWDRGGFRVYNYSGTLVNTVSSSIEPKTMFCFDGGSKLAVLGEISNVGAYFSIYSLSGTDITLIDTYTIDSSTSNYLYNNVGYIHLYDSTSFVFVVAVSGTNPIKEFYFDGSTISLKGEYPYSGNGVVLAGKGISGDSIFINSSSDYVGNGPYGLAMLDKLDYSVQSYESLTTAPGVCTYGDGYCAISKWSTGSRVKLYRVLPTPGHEQFQAVWR